MIVGVRRDRLGVAALANGLGCRRIRVNYIGQLAKPHLAVHRHSDFADHIAGMAADDRRTQDLVFAFFDMNLNKSFGLPVDDGTVDVIELPGKCFKFNVLFLQILLIQSHMRHFRFRVGRPRNDQIGKLVTTKEKRISNYAQKAVDKKKMEPEKAARVVENINYTTDYTKIKY